VKFLAVFLNLFQKHSGEGRVVLPLLKTIDLLMNRVCIEPLMQDESFTSELLSQMKQELEGCSDIPRLHAILNVATGLIRSVEQSPQATAFVCSLLSHEFPRIRSLAAEKLYVRIQETNPELSDDHRAMKLLLHHTWEANKGRAEEDAKSVACEVTKALNPTVTEAFLAEIPASS
jgi:Tubulin folding cofactor D C terminal